MPTIGWDTETQYRAQLQVANYDIAAFLHIGMTSGIEGPSISDIERRFRR